MWPWRDPQAGGALPADGNHRLGWRLIRSRATRLGWGLLFACLLLWVMAVNYQINVAYVLVFWLLGMLAVATAMTWLQLLGLSLRADSREEHFAGEPIHLRISAADNRHRHLWLQTGGHGESDGSEDPGQWQAWTSAAGAETVWTLPPQPRGRLSVPPLRCVSMAPFGVLLAESLWHYQGDAVVYPAPIAHTLPSHSHADGQDAAERRTVASGDDVAYLQEHQAGSSLQQIAWKQFAKSGQLLDKRFEHPVAAVAPDRISYQDYPPHTPRERLAGLLCHRVLLAEQQRRPYTLILPHRSIGPCPGQRQLCLTALGLWS